MNDPPIQPDAVQSEQPPHPLAERLLRRRAEPIGLIDVRQPQRIHARTAGWVARRFALLDHWRTRYGGDEPAPPASGEMVLTAPVLPLREGGGGVPHAMAARALEPSDAPPDATKESVTGSRVRISRRPPTLSRATDPASPSDAPRNSGGVERPRLAQTVDQVDQAAQPSEIPISTDAPQAQPLILPRRSGDPIGTAAKDPAGDPAHSPEGVTESPSRAPSEQSVSKRFDSRRTGANADARVTVSAGQPMLARSHELSQPGINISDAQIWRKPAVTAGASLPARVAGIEGQLIEPAAEKQKATGGVVSPLALELPTLQRQLGGEEGSDQPMAGQSARAAEPRPLAVTPEIPPPASDAPPHMIWRKSAAGPLASGGLAPARVSSPATPLPLKIDAPPAGVPTLARAIGIEGSLPSVAPEMPSELAAPPIDVAQLAEQVGRILSRTLEVERERRGMK